jgi:lysophospholipase L1-like esterase
MRSGLTVGSALGLTLLALVASASFARAEEAEACPVPASLLATESSLPKVADAVKGGRPLDILVIGSRSSTIGGSQDGAYPARLQAALKDKLPQVTVNVSVEVQSKQTAEEGSAGFVKLMEDKKPTLVIWQTGTVDAMRSTDPDDFHAAVDGGVTALQNAGADVILMNLQYSPRTETMISGSPYMDNIRAVAQEHDVPLFDRFSIMRQWNEQGDFDLFSAVHGPELARRVHDCIGRALSNFVFDAAHLGPAQQN